MRLRKIKMAGFKSFVDPTTLVFPSDMVGIVGPNGCGKSNIVDAIRWVMGASSKNIRGDTLEDVIFKGSSGRKPVGQASIELIFDNSQGLAGGQYASYNEIAIRRSVARDGQSKYFLNGTQCRRRDISDIFLGTGLGPRSYAIIEQGTISRLIDAKPEEMRVHLEEAAGISKYKERRRETENRIRHTRENLDRLNDLIDEVDKQIAKLKRQAAAAERYKKLKQEERRTNAELLLLRLDSMGNELGEQQKLVEHQETQVEQTIASLRSVEANLEQLREDHTTANDSMNEVQGHYYQIGADISRLEQSIQHATETKRRHEAEREEAQASLASIQEELDKQGSAQDDFEQQIENMTHELHAVSEQASEIGEEVTSAESAELNWREAWEDLIHESSEPTHQVEVFNQRIEFLDEEIIRLEQRRDRYQTEHDQLLKEDHQDDLSPIETQLSQSKQSLDQSQSSLDKVISDIQQSKEIVEDFTVQLDKDKTRQQELKSTLTTLEALQEAALKGDQQPMQDWITRHSFDQAPRLADQVEVEAGWELAVETVLSGYLEAICIDDLNSVTKKLEGLESGNVMFYDTHNSASKQFSADTLASKVSTDLPVYSELEQILIADSLANALKVHKQLKPGQSVITPNGYWLGENWVRYSSTANSGESVLVRKAEISELQDKLGQVNRSVDDISKQLQQATLRLAELEVQREQSQQQYNSVFQQHAEVQAELSRHQSALEHWQHRDQQLRTFIQEASHQLEDYLDQKQVAAKNLESAQSNLDILHERKDKLLNRK
ncbi:MAG: chromosome segregation protein SMC, partial [Pseudomonadota bacterium]